MSILTRIIGGLLLSVLATVVVPVLHEIRNVGPTFQPFPTAQMQAIARVSGPNVRFQRVDPDEPSWTKSLELAAALVKRFAAA